MGLLLLAGIGVSIGLLAGVVANDRGRLENIILGTVGSIIGGRLLTLATGASSTAPSIPTTAAALLASVLFIALARRLARGRSHI